MSASLHQVAIHESGHALVCLALGGGVYHLDAGPDPHCRLEWEVLSTRRLAMIDAAGVIAEQVAGYAPRCEVSEWGVDGERLLSRAGHVDGGLAYIAAATTRLLTARRPLLLALADHLASVGYLNSADLADWWRLRRVTGSR
jgi:hypothetical protein